MKSSVGILLGVIFNLWINSGTVDIFIKFIWNEVIHPSLYQFICLIIISSSQFSSVSQSCSTLCNTWTAAYQASLSITNSQSLLELMSIESEMPSNNLIPCCPLLLLPSIFSSIRVFSNKSVLCIRWPKYWSFSFSIRPANEYSGLISFRIDQCDLLAVQDILKSLLQHHNWKASILQRSIFFMVQISHLYITTRKTIALTIWTFVNKWFLCFLIHCLGLS